MIISILEQTRALGASLAGMTSVAALRNAPSYQVSSGTVEFPSTAKSVLVLALRHLETEPELDWWGYAGGTPGNQKLQEISKSLQTWLNEEHHIQAHPIPYHIERGGI